MMPSHAALRNQPDHAPADPLTFTFDDRHWRVRGLDKQLSCERLKDNLLTQILLAGVLALLVAALLCAVLTIQPRKYRFYEHNLSEMRKEWVQLFTYKSNWLRRANWLFFAGTLLLAVSIGILIFYN